MGKIGKNKLAEEFEKLYFDHYSQLCRSIYRFIKDEDITKDIAQEVFLNYWQKTNPKFLPSKKIIKKQKMKFTGYRY